MPFAPHDAEDPHDAEEQPHHEPPCRRLDAGLLRRGLDDADHAEGVSADYELRLGEDRFHAQVADGRFQIARGAAEQPAATIEADPRTLAAVIYGGRDLTKATAAGDVTIEGDKTSVERFLALFTLPEPARTVTRR